MSSFNSASGGEDQRTGSNRSFVVAAVCGGLAIAVVIVVRLGYEVTEEELPPAPPEPRPSNPGLVASRYHPEMYAAYLKLDAERFACQPITVNDLGRPFPRFGEGQRRCLTAGAPPIETRFLKFAVRTEKRNANLTQGYYVTSHMVLRIENKTTDYLAYRVDTSPEGTVNQCMTKTDLVHNAMAIAPRESVERTECVYREGMALRIERVETVILPELAYHYVSMLVPAHIGMDPRSSRGHRPTKGEPCVNIPEQAIHNGVQKGQTTWFDVIDFYARHRCETYLFPSGYRAWKTAGEQQLPVAAAPARDSGM
ncbi:MAG: hypothetical protein V2A73_11135 [Pseudomonadota bacterium]